MEARTAVRIVHLTLLGVEDVLIARYARCRLTRIHEVQRKMGREIKTGHGYGCPDYRMNSEACEHCLDSPDEPCPYSA